MIYVVEPHADDAFLSLGGHIERWITSGGRVTIVTVYSGTRKRGRDAKAYADAVGAGWRGLGFVESGSSSKAKPLPEDVFHGVFSDDPVILGPVGFQHAEHREVYDRLPSWSQFYLDVPYAIALKNSDPITECISGMIVVSYLRPPFRKWRHIPLFRDQGKFFWMNPPEKLKHTFELILRRP